MNHCDEKERQDVYAGWLEHHTQRFAIAASQRMQAVNFFMATEAVLGVAAAALPSTHLRARIAILLAGFAVTVLFYLIEVRTKRLIDEAERAMDKSAKQLRRAQRIDDDVAIIDTKHGVLRYGNIFNVMFGGVALIQLLSIGYFCGKLEFGMNATSPPAVDAPRPSNPNQTK